MAATIQVDVFECRGSPYEAGRLLGQSLLKRRGPAARQPAGRPAIEPFDLDDARRTLGAWAPNLWDELNGLADGLELPVAEAAARFSNGRMPFPAHGCSSLVGGGILGRNYDFSPARYDRALVAVQAAGSHASVGFSERALGRLDGLNAAGLAVALHYVNDQHHRPGLASPLVVRILLDQCATTAEAIDLSRRLPHALAFNYSVLDGSGDGAVIEASPEQVAVRRGGALACTNHFQATEMAAANPAAIRGSRNRLPPLEGWAAQGLDAGALFGALNDARSAVFQHGYDAGYGTLHTIVADPAGRAMLVGIGGDAAPRRIDVGAWAAGKPLGRQRLRGRLDAGGDRLFRGRDMSGADFGDVSLARAEFRNVSLAGARFDDIDFSGAEIGSYCNFRGMRIAGVALEDLFAAYNARGKKRSSGPAAE